MTRVSRVRLSAYELIGDRFLSSGSSRGIDLATGQPADVLVRSFEHEWPAIERYLEAQLLSSGDARLVDYGRIDTSHWFEARAPAGQPRPHGLSAANSLIDDIALTAEATRVGVRHRRVELPLSETLPAMSALARRLRASGFVTVRAGVQLPEALRLAFAHRHVAIVSCHGDDPAMTVRWLRGLVSVSPRGHAVIEFEPANAFHARTSGDQVVEWLAYVERAITSANALFARSELERTEAVLGAIEVEAAVRRLATPASVGDAWVRLRMCQGRLEEARRHQDEKDRGQVEECGGACGSRYSVVAAAGTRR